MVEDFWSEIVKSDIHLKLLKNIEENSEKKENDKSIIRWITILNSTKSKNVNLDDEKKNL